MFRGPRVLDIYGMVYLQYNFEQGVRPRYGMIQYAVPPLVHGGKEAGTHSTEGRRTHKYGMQVHTPRKQGATLHDGRSQTPTAATIRQDSN